jgi:hypothetical protein
MLNVQKKLIFKEQVMKNCVMLCIAADSHKLSSHIVLNRKAMSENKMFPKDVILDGQKVDG